MTDLRLVYSAISDVGRVRKDNQDSGYAGPWLLAVADGVGGAVRGDIASSTAIQEIRKLDAEPSDDLLAQVAGALHRAHDRIGELVEQDSSLNGTSTTAVVTLFDGTLDTEVRPRSRGRHRVTVVAGGTVARRRFRASWDVPAA